MMKKLKAVLACLLLTAGCSSKPKPVEEKKTLYGMWFSFLDFQTMNMESTESFQSEAEQIFDNLFDLGINTVYVHASAYTDAWYTSSIYPKAEEIKDTEIDPLRVFTTLAHEHDMHIEAWINPLRSVEVGQEERQTNEQIAAWIKRNDERVRPVAGRWYLNPAYPEVRNLVTSVASEILDNYDVDGIHIDDYFYPESAEQKFDAYIYGLAHNENAELTLQDFRIENINTLVRELHKTAHDHDKVFTISVAGNMENNLQKYYADPNAWVKEKTVDLLIPQIYWGFEHPTKPFEATLDEWLRVTEGTDIPMAVGLAAYKIGTEDTYAQAGAREWVNASDMMSRQTQKALEKGCVGAVYFRYDFLYKSRAEVFDQVQTEIANLKRIIGK